MDEKRIREALKDKQRIVLKIGSSSIIHEETGGADYRKLETLVRIICDLKNQGKDVILVSSVQLVLDLRCWDCAISRRRYP